VALAGERIEVSGSSPFIEEALENAEVGGKVDG